MKYARIVDGTAADICGDINQRFHPDLASQFVQVPDEVEAGWMLVEGVWSAPPPFPEYEAAPAEPEA